MADLENLEDDWARGVFNRVRTGQHEPHWIPDAATAARLSGRRRTRVRATGVLAAVAIVGLSATAFTTLGGNVFRSRDTVSPASGPATWNGLDLTKYLMVDGVWATETRNPGGHDKFNADSPMSVTGLTSIAFVLKRLDPDLSHVRTTSGPHRLVIGPAIPGTSNVQLHASGYWAPNGDVSSFPPIGTPYRPTTPFGEVDITVRNPQPRQGQAIPDSPCGIGGVATYYPVPRPKTWSTCVRQHQSDGSDIFIAHSTDLPAGRVTVATRVFPDGSSVMIAASTVIGYTPRQAGQPSGSAEFLTGPALNPVPWTDDSLVRALTGPAIKGLS